MSPGHSTAQSGRKVAVKDRVAHGLCPQCGGEAAPYRLCYSCRLKGRLDRSLKKGTRTGALSVLGAGRGALYNINKNAPPDADRNWGKHGTLINLPESDGRSRPRLRGIRVDVEATLVKVMEFIGRPATIDEITQAWGRLRDRRSAPLASDLGRIIAAADKRARKAAKRAAAFAKSEAGRAGQ